MKKLLCLPRYNSNCWPEYLSIFYLALPYFFFFAGWIKQIYAIPAIIVLILAIKQFFIYCDEKNNYFHLIENKKSIFKLIIFVALLFYWVFLSGSGGFHLQNGDYEKHNAILYDLCTMEWPVTYRGNAHYQSIYHLSYYFAYYLPSAFIGKFLGIAVAMKMLFVWTLMGIFLSAFWIIQLTKKLSLTSILLFILFSGMDIIGQLIIKNPELTPISHIEWWTGYGFWQYSSTTASLFWVPQHAISCWLSTSLLLNIIRSNHEKTTVPSLFIFSLSALWSPFVMLGLIPLLAFTLWRKGWHKFISFENLVTAPILLLICGLFFSANILDHRSGFIWNFHNSFSLLFIRYMQFCLLEFLIFAALIFPWVRKSKPVDKQLFALTVTTLFLIPIYVMGYYNDFAMRSSLPSIFVLMLFAINFIHSPSPALSCKLLKFALGITLVIGSFTALTEINRGFKYPGRAFGFNNVPNMSLPHVSIQYFADHQSFFYRHLAASSATEVAIPPQVLNLLHKKH